MTITVDDIVAIQQIYHLEGHLHDDEAWDRLNEVYTDDIEYDLSAFGAGVLPGLAATKAMYRGLTHPASMNVSNVQVSEADGKVRVLAKIMSPGQAGEFQCVDCEDEAVRTSAGWRIARRCWKPKLFTFQSETRTTEG